MVLRCAKITNKGSKITDIGTSTLKENVGAMYAKILF